MAKKKSEVENMQVSQHSGKPVLYAVPSSHVSRRLLKKELQTKLQMMDAEYKRFGEHIQLIEKQRADLLAEAKKVMEYSQTIADALLEDEYNALVSHGI